MNLPISRQVLAGFSAIIILVVGVSALGIVAIERLNSASDQVLEEDVANGVDALRLHAALDEEALQVRAFLLNGDEGVLPERDDARDEFTEIAARLQASLSPEGRQLVGTAERAKAEWEELAQELIDARDGDEEALEAIAPRVQAEEVPARREVRSAIDALVERQTELVVASTAAADREALRSRWLILGLGATALVLSIVAATVITRTVARRVTELSSDIDAAAAEILSGTQQQLEGASRQSTGVQETVATVEELDRTADQSAERARTVASTAQRSSESAEAGRASVEEAVTGIEELRSQVDGIAGTIVELADRAQAISDVVRTVDDIAEQTHLLALNASIEAARAGEHGRGFAVVAGEVRSLAEESRAATGRVSTIIDEIQQSTHTAVMVSEQGTKSATRGAELVNSAGETIRELAATIEEATLAAEQIAGSAGQQAIATSQITQAMHDIRDATEQGLASSHQVEQRARELDTVAQRVRALAGERR